jgi:hypothetical protein
VLKEPEGGFTDVIKNSLKGMRSPTDWARIFPVLETAATLGSSQQIDLIARGERDVPAGPTPMKRRIVLFKEEEEGNAADPVVLDGTNSDFSDNESTIADKYNELQMKGKMDVSEATVHMMNHWNGLVSLSTEHQNRLKGVDVFVRSSLEEIDDKVVNIASLVGKKPHDSVLPLTLWSAVESVSENVDDLKSQTTSVEASANDGLARIEVIAAEMIDISDQIKGKVSPAVDSLQTLFTGLESKMRSVIPESGNRTLEQHEITVAQRALQVEMDNIKLVLSQMGNLQHREGGTLGNPVNSQLAVLKQENSLLTATVNKLSEDLGSVVMVLSQLKDEYETDLAKAKEVLRNEFQSATQAQLSTQAISDSARSDVYAVRLALETLRKEVREVKSGTTIGRSSGSDGEDVAGIAVSLAMLTDEVKALQLDHNALRSEVVTETMTFGGHTFLTPESYSQFILKHFPSAYYGYCVDFISMLELGSDQNRTTIEGLKNMKTVSGAGFVNSYEGLVFASFGTYFPSLFGVENDPKDPYKKMGSMTNALEWDPKTSRSGRKNTINNTMTAMKRSLEIQINSVNSKMSAEALMFFRNLILNTWVFWEALASWIARFENEMCSLTPGENPATHKAQIWNLICWMLHSMFMEMGVRRADGGVATIVEKEDKVAVCAAILQGTLGAHKFMKELIDNDFGRHPLFASTMVEFLITTKAPYIAVEELQTSVKRIDATTRMLQAAKDRKGAARVDS